MAVYLITTQDGKERIVEAKQSNAALNHVIKKDVKIR